MRFKLALSIDSKKINKNKVTLKSKLQPAHDHSGELKRMSRIKGQLLGVERMIVDKRYCPEIVVQIKAVRAALKSLEANIVEGHMRHCVKDAIKSRDPLVVQEKIEEILILMKGQES